MLASAVAAAPAQASTDSSAATQTTQSDRHHNRGPYYSHGSEDQRHESYWSGYWQKRDGHYYLYGDVYDRHHGDHDYSYVWYRYYDRGGNLHRDYYRSDDHRHISGIQFTRDFDVRVCEGDSPSDGCSRYYDVY
jgi:hypothetical protein